MDVHIHVIDSTPAVAACAAAGIGVLVNGMHDMRTLTNELDDMDRLQYHHYKYHLRRIG